LEGLFPFGLVWAGHGLLESGVVGVVDCRFCLKNMWLNVGNGVGAEVVGEVITNVVGKLTNACVNFFGKQGPILLEQV
jgi:hypothetical protein